MAFNFIHNHICKTAVIFQWPFVNHICKSAVIFQWPFVNNHKILCSLCKVFFQDSYISLCHFNSCFVDVLSFLSYCFYLFLEWSQLILFPDLPGYVLFSMFLLFPLHNTIMIFSLMFPL